MSKIEDILSTLPHGEERRVYPSLPPCEQKFRYCRPGQNLDYGDYSISVGWKNVPPHPKVRGLGDVPLGDLVEDSLVFNGGTERLMDYYSVEWLAAIVSERFHNVFLAVDPLGIDSRKMKVKVPKSREAIEYWAVRPVRVLEALDVERTEFWMTHQVVIPGYPQREVYFDKGCCFHDAVTNGVPTFVDYDTCQWLWSEGFLNAAQAAGVRGFYAVEPCKGGREFMRL